MFYAIKPWAFTGPLKNSQRLFKPIAELMCFYVLFTVVLNLNPHLILAPYFNSKAFFCSSHSEFWLCSLFSQPRLHVPDPAPLKNTATTMLCWGNSISQMREIPSFHQTNCLQFWLNNSIFRLPQFFKSIFCKSQEASHRFYFCLSLCPDLWTAAKGLCCRFCSLCRELLKLSSKYWWYILLPKTNLLDYSICPNDQHYERPFQFHI